MAAFVLIAPTGVSGAPRSGTRLNIFPGSASPTVFAACMPFWIGYGFVPEEADGSGEVHAGTRFELALDGEPVTLHTDVRVEARRAVEKFTFADFPEGLPVGWHRFAGRWYDGGSLVLTSDRAIEFVEP